MTNPVQSGDLGSSPVADTHRVAETPVVSGLTAWTLHCEPLDYLDGIQSGLIVKADNGAPVAYMFDHKRALLATAAPDLLEAISKLADAVEPLVGTPPVVGPITQRVRDALVEARAAYAKATGETQ